MTADRFWETFWLAFLGIAILSVFGSTFLFFQHIHNINAAAVGVSFEEGVDPFESNIVRANLSLVGGYVYRNALPLGVRAWRWDSVVDWNSTAQIFEGSASLQATYVKPWGGFGISGFALPRGDYSSISISVFVDSLVEDLYLELYDSSDRALVRQSLAWYAPGHKLEPGRWYSLTVPIKNLLGSSPTKTINGVSISGKQAGVAYIDDLQFSTNPSTHPVWVPPITDAPPFNPFATSTPIELPYTATFDESDFERWYSYWGLLGKGAHAFLLGPKEGSTDSVAVFRSGKLWSDYKVDVTLDWGLTSSFSLLLRLADMNNYAICGFSTYAQNVQIYHVKNGKSTQLAQSPPLQVANFDEPWKNVRVGASIEGNRVSCYVQGQRELSYEIPDLPRAGTLGLEAWDSNHYSSPHTIKRLEVIPMIGK